MKKWRSWASAWLRAEAHVDDQVVWNALNSLAMADLISSDRPYLYGRADFEAWLSDLRRHQGRSEMTNKNMLLELMQRFMSGDRSMALAGEIEVGLAELFGDREPFADLSLMLASYRPGGGEYLYEEQQIVVWMRHATERVAAELRTRTNT